MINLKTRHCEWINCQVERIRDEMWQAGSGEWFCSVHSWDYLKLAQAQWSHKMSERAGNV